MPQKAQTNFATQAKICLVRRGWTVTQLAKRIGKSRTAVSTALHHPTMHAKVQALIREELSL